MSRYIPITLLDAQVAEDFGVPNIIIHASSDGLYDAVSRPSFEFEDLLFRVFDGDLTVEFPTVINLEEERLTSWANKKMILRWNGDEKTHIMFFVVPISETHSSVTAHHWAHQDVKSLLGRSSRTTRISVISSPVVTTFEQYCNTIELVFL
jgi:hypothetical protein